MCVCVCFYLVGICMCERCVILARAVGGSIFVHGGGWRGFIQQTAFCRNGRQKWSRGVLSGLGFKIQNHAAIVTATAF